ncbi:MAG: 4Fe-4S binding protein [Candidatus Latescibacteria bacterium]|nr:4Fe-4S binding protein [Candidatus Latescibacterota bacterium]
MKCLGERCDRCGVCTAVCPFDAVTVDESGVTFLDDCTQCDLCAQACPTGAIVQVLSGAA